MKYIYITLVIATIISALGFSGCAPTKEIAEKSGAQLWGENCNRCHNAPSPDQYPKEKWSIIGAHMKMKSGITDDDVVKIVAFLKGE